MVSEGNFALVFQKGVNVFFRVFPNLDREMLVVHLGENLVLEHGNGR